ncbi:MAG: glycosyltransferase [Pleurocapsa minor HA4230-MV1]|jgi:dolichol-phosphate mannosyltransferase|nr:glycosyltransferase [Pleurocapsa minor HA4230-MV1]
MQDIIPENLIPVPIGLLKIANFTANFKSKIKPLKLSLIIPTYNEEENIQQLITILVQLLDEILLEEYELIVVDDNSPDKTWKLALELTSTYTQLKVMRRDAEKGLATAVIRGWQVARGEILGVIDADLQHPPQTLIKLWQEIEKGADLAVASRNVEYGGVSEWNILRRFLSRGAQILGLLILPEVIGRLSDPMSGYFMVRREALIDRSLQPSGYKILIEVLARGKIRWIGEVGYIFQERKIGNSKVTFQQYVEYIQHLIRLRLDLWQIRRFVRFGISGFSGVFVNMFILYLLREYIGLGLTRSAILAAEVAIINNFFWNDRWTFRDISEQQKGRIKTFRRFLKFNVICLSGLVLNILVLNLLYNLLNINEYLANLIAIATVTFWNFWFNLKLSWRITDTNNQDSNK